MGYEKDTFQYEAKHLSIDNISPDNGIKKGSIGNAPWWFKLQLVLIAMSALVLISGFAGIILPYAPLHIYGWKDIPDQICPGEQFVPSTVTAVESGPYTINDVEGFASVVSTNNKVVDTWDIHSDLSPHPRQVQPSGVIRTAPDVRGYYHISLNLIVHGRTFGVVPRYQEIEKTSEKSFFVLSESDSRC